MLKQEKLHKIAEKGTVLVNLNDRLAIASDLLHKVKIIYDAFDGNKTEHWKKAFDAIDEMKRLCEVQISKNTLEINNLISTYKDIEDAECLNL